MNRIALIPAKGHSRRLPGKNIVDFFGKPIIAYTITAAIDSNVFERVIVSTEDEKIAAIAELYGAENVVRPQSLSTDEATLLDVASHVIECIRKDGQEIDEIVVLLATAPLRTAKDITSTVNMIESGVCDFAIGATPINFPPHQAMRVDSDGFLQPLFPAVVNQRGEWSKGSIVDNGSIYACVVSALLKQKTFFGDKLKCHIMPRARSIDIDTPDDLEEVKRVYDYLSRNATQ